MPATLTDMAVAVQRLIPTSFSGDAIRTIGWCFLRSVYEVSTLVLLIQQSPQYKSESSCYCICFHFEYRHHLKSNLCRKWYWTASLSDSVFFLASSQHSRGKNQALQLMQATQMVLPFNLKSHMQMQSMFLSWYKLNQSPYCWASVGFSWYWHFSQATYAI